MATTIPNDESIAFDSLNLRTAQMLPSFGVLVLTSNNDTVLPPSDFSQLLLITTKFYSESTRFVRYK